MKKTQIYFALIALVFLSCKNPQENVKPISKGLASPVYLNQKETEVYLTDYILQTHKIDSIENSESYTTRLSEDKTKLFISPTKQCRPIENLRLYVAGKTYSIPLFKSTKEAVVFLYPKDKKHKEVAFKSQIVEWQSVPMQENEKEWFFKANLDPGNYQYLFVVDGKEQLDPNNAKTIGNGSGGTNSLFQIKDNPLKVPFLITKKQDAKSFSITSKNTIGTAFIYLNNQLLGAEHVKLTANTIEVSLPSQTDERSYVRIFAFNEFGSSNDVLIPLHKGRVISNTERLKRTDFHTQIMYFLLVDRFLDGDKENTKLVISDSILPKVNYMGGDLQGVVDKIKDDYFSDLGINTIWLSPITQNPEGAFGFWPDPVTKFSGYHGYWSVLNTKIDYRFGNKKVLEDLLAKAHKKDFNVLLDYVANHIHKENPIYINHPDWATNLYLPDGTMNLEKWDEHRLTTWFDTFLPTLDFSKKEVVEKMSDTATFWLTEFDLDGFRHDATKHIQLEFWRMLTNKIKERTNRPIYQIGETYGSPELIRSYVNTGMLDGQFNFNLYDTSVAVFANEDESIDRLSDALSEALKYYGSHHLMGNITGNQDRARFISYASGDVKFDEDAKVAGWTREIKMSDSKAYDKLAMLHAFNLTIPGIPCIYYGDEYGSIGANDPDNRRMMKFKDLDKHELALKEKVKELIHLRNNSMALLYGSTEIETGNDNILIIKRQYFDEVVYSVFNKSDQVFIFKDKKIQPGSFEVIKK